MALEYLVKRIGLPWEAKIFVNDVELGVIEIGKKGACQLIGKSSQWILSPKIDGEYRPFSMVASLFVSKTGTEDEKVGAADPTLKIRDNLFHYNKKFYLIGGVPEGMPLREVLTGKKYICRLDTFPHSHPDEIDHMSRSRLRKLRGIAVGELYGLGTEGFHAKLGDELEDIGLPLAASTYIIYSTV